jgi:hypothetical protein
MVTEERVADKDRIVLAVQHDGGDTHNLDECNRQGQDQRAERFAKTHGKMLCVAHDRQG